MPKKTMQNNHEFIKSYSPRVIESWKISESMYHKLTELSIITEFFPPDYAATGQLIEELVKKF
ncbi:MAG: hypothetical protein HGA42_09795 [Nostocales cyanobacterium W4_Combined_metabat2_030]|nr:hypothetical protein [Nostocales cyanobacterium W4_Combined_metabat2_030]